MEYGEKVLCGGNLRVCIRVAYQVSDWSHSANREWHSQNICARPARRTQYTGFTIIINVIIIRLILALARRSMARQTGTELVDRKQQQQHGTAYLFDHSRRINHITAQNRWRQENLYIFFNVSMCVYVCAESDECLFCSCFVDFVYHIIHYELCVP